MIKTLIFMMALLSWAGGVAAADKPQYGPPPSWVRPIEIPKAIPDAESATALQVLLQNQQRRYGLDGDEFYNEVATRINSAQGLAAAGNLILPWEPDTQTLTINRLQIIRGDQVIDAVAGGKGVTVLRRETNLERSTLDGALTATVQPAGLQVGDIIDLAFTIRKRDPVFQGYTEDSVVLGRPGVIARVYIRGVWPKSKPIRWRTTEGFGQPVVQQTADGEELVIDRSNAEAPKPPVGAPSRFNDLAELELSQFQSWAEVSALMAPLYAKAEVLAPDSLLISEIKKIKAESADPKTQAAMALRLVEDKVRYVALSMNNGGYVPTNANLTWSRRFGDCKGKTVLLLALLKGLGIEAEPALVSTLVGDGLNQRLPMLGLFDHVLVRAKIGGKTYWLDGTRLGDEHLESLPTPQFFWALPVRPTAGALESLAQPPYADPHFESIVRLDATAGLDLPAPAHAEQLFRGDEGLAMHLALEALTHADADRAMREYWRKQIPWVDPQQVNISYVDGTTTLSMDGPATIDWSKNGTNRDFNIDDSSLGYDANFDREPGPNRDAPYAVPYPMYKRWTVVVHLPNKGEGFVLVNSAAVGKTVAGVDYQRKSSIEKGVATVEASERALTPEFPASDASAASAALRELSNYNVVIRAQSPTDKVGLSAVECAGQGSNPDQAIAQCTALLGIGGLADEKKATTLVDRGTAYGRKNELDLAIRDYDQAITIYPKLALAFTNRCYAYVLKKITPLAIDDCSEAIKLEPNSTRAYLNRADAYLLRENSELARRDFEMVLSLDPDSAPALLALCNPFFQPRDQKFDLKNYDLPLKRCDRLLATVPSAEGFKFRGFVHLIRKEFGPAIQDFDKATDLGSADGYALGGRAWARLMTGDLDGALKDANEALRLDPRIMYAHDARAGVYEARHEYAAALPDLDALTQLNPGKPNLERAGVRLQMGNYAGAMEDIDRAIELKRDLIEAYHLRSQVHRAMGRRDLELQDINAAARIAPTDATALNARCWTRAEANIELAAALIDCNAALALEPTNGSIVDSRAFIYFRMGQLDKALAEYDAALKIDPKMASSIYIRGIIKRRRGDNTGGDADIAAAKAIDTKVVDSYAKLGVTP